MNQRDLLLREFFPPPRTESTYQIEIDVTAGRVVDGELESMRIEITTGEQLTIPTDWQLVGATEAAWQVAEGLGYPLRLNDASQLLKNLSEEELQRWS